MKLITFILLFIPLFSYSQDEFDEFNDSSNKSANSSLQLNGFIEFEQGMRTSNSGPHKETDFLMANRKFRLQTSKSFNKGSIYGKLDFLNDDITNENTVDIREMRFQYKLSDYVDLSVGRQVSTWGVADMLFINDLFPKNWVANFQGRDMEMLKAPSNSIRLTSYVSEYTFDLVYQPKFTADVVPTGCKFSIFDPNSNAIIANTGSCTTNTSYGRDNNRSNENEIALSIKKKIGNHEVATYGYTGFYKSPTSLKLVGSTLTPYHSRLNVYGLSDEGQIGPGIFTFEAGYYDSVEDQGGDNYFIPNSTLKYLIGYKQDLSANFSYGLQFYQENMMNYDSYKDSYLVNNPTGYAYRKKELQTTYTLRLTYKAQQETLWFSVFSYIRPDDKDSFTKLEVSKKLDDNFKVVFGGNIFTGDDNYASREFGMLKDDDNVFTRFNYTF